MRNDNLRMIVEAGILIALGYILSLVKIWQAPMGGSVTAGSMIPVMLFALRWGYKKGVLVAVIYGIIQFMLGPKWSYHPVSIIFDYLVAFGALGIVGYFRHSKKQMYIGVFVAIFVRYIAHVISGVVVFASYAPESMSPIIYSLVYNSQYLIPEFIVSVLVFSFLYNPLKQNKLLS